MTLQSKTSGRSKKILWKIAHEASESPIVVIEHAVPAYQREWRMQKLNNAYANLRRNPRAWKEELKERSTLEKTSEDGLNDV